MSKLKLVPSALNEITERIFSGIERDAERGGGFLDDVGNHARAVVRHGVGEAYALGIQDAAAERQAAVENGTETGLWRSLRPGVDIAQDGADGQRVEYEGSLSLRNLREILRLQGASSGDGLMLVIRSAAPELEVLEVVRRAGFFASRVMRELYAEYGQIGYDLKLGAKVAGRCPSCDRDGLFVSPGGRLTCSQDGCKDRSAASNLLSTSAHETDLLSAVAPDPVRRLLSRHLQDRYRHLQELDHSDGPYTSPGWSVLASARKDELDLIAEIIAEPTAAELEEVRAIGGDFASSCWGCGGMHERWFRGGILRDGTAAHCGSCGAIWETVSAAATEESAAELADPESAAPYPPGVHGRLDAFDARLTGTAADAAQLRHAVVAELALISKRWTVLNGQVGEHERGISQQVRAHGAHLARLAGALKVHCGTLTRWKREVRNVQDKAATKAERRFEAVHGRLGRLERWMADLEQGFDERLSMALDERRALEGRIDSLASELHARLDRHSIED